jgi:hypothetical protein
LGHRFRLLEKSFPGTETKVCLANSAKAGCMMLVVAITALAISANTTAGAGPIADELGIYLPESPGKCAEDEFAFKKACLPSGTLLTYDVDYILIGYLDLVDPEGSKAAQRDYIRRSSTRAEAYAVEVDHFAADIFKLVDGSVLEKVSPGYVGYVGYHEGAVLFRDGQQWNLCVNGDIHRVELLKNGGSHYSRDRLSKTIKEVEDMDACR